MKLYAVKTEEGYLKTADETVYTVPLNKASVFSDIEKARALLIKHNKGQIVELTLTERIL